VLLSIQDFQQQENLNSRTFIKQYSQMLQARNKMASSNNVSLPTSPTSPTTPGITIKASLSNKPIVKGRRASWIPGRH
jgi:hypothetical protein